MFTCSKIKLVSGDNAGPLSDIPSNTGRALFLLFCVYIRNYYLIIYKDIWL